MVLVREKLVLVHLMQLEHWWMYNVGVNCKLDTSSIFVDLTLSSCDLLSSVYTDMYKWQAILPICSLGIKVEWGEVKQNEVG